jgi:hypothetical protein
MPNQIPSKNHETAVSRIEIKCAFLVVLGIQPKRLNRTIAI